jgi:uncharacterized protein YbcV (DUF1398 family)
MNEPISTTLNQITSQLPDSPVKKQIVGILKASIGKEQEAIEALLEAKKSGQISQQEFEQELAREQQIVEAEMLTWQIAAKAEIQKVVNQTFQTLARNLI